MLLIKQCFSDFDFDEHSKKCGFETGSDSPVQQQFAEDCSIDRMMLNYSRTGNMAVVPEGVTRYGDFVDIPKTLQDFYAFSERVDSSVDSLMSQIPESDRSRIYNRDQLLDYLAAQVALKAKPDESKDKPDNS